MYRQMLIKKILETVKREMSTNEIVEASGMTKQGFVQMMHRMDIMPCRVEKARGHHGLYFWDMVEVRAALREDLKLGVMKKC